MLQMQPFSSHFASNAIWRVPPPPSVPPYFNLSFVGMYQDVATNMIGHELCFQTGTKTFNLNIASTEVYFLHDGVWSETQSCQIIPGFHWRPHFFKRMPLDIYFDILRDRRHPNLLRNLLKFYMSFFLWGLGWKSRASCKHLLELQYESERPPMKI